MDGWMTMGVNGGYKLLMSDVGKLMVTGAPSAKKACIPLSQSQPCLQNRSVLFLEEVFS